MEGVKKSPLTTFVAAGFSLALARHFHFSELPAERPPLRTAPSIFSHTFMAAERLPRSGEI